MGAFDQDRDDLDAALKEVGMAPFPDSPTASSSETLDFSSATADITAEALVGVGGGEVEGAIVGQRRLLGDGEMSPATTLIVLVSAMCR